MALPSSGTLKLSDIQGEFGGSNPIKLSEYYGADAGVPNSGTIKVSDFYGKSSFTAFGYRDFINVGWQSMNAPAGVSSICIVCIGGGGGGGAALWGGGGGGGGALTYVNDVPVTPGEKIEVYVANGGNNLGRGDGTDGQGTQARLPGRGNKIICWANGGRAGAGQNVGEYGKCLGGNGGGQWNYVNDFGASLIVTVNGYWGGSGYNDWAGGGGGAAGYSNTGPYNAGWGGSEHPDEKSGGLAGKSGGGGGGNPLRDDLNTPGTGRNGRSGGGVGLKKGSNGAGGETTNGSGNGGSGGGNGSSTAGGKYGGGGGATSEDMDPDRRACVGGSGACRIIWGTGKSFPNNF